MQGGHTHSTVLQLSAFTSLVQSYRGANSPLDEDDFIDDGAEPGVIVMQAASLVTSVGSQSVGHPDGDAAVAAAGLVNALCENSWTCEAAVNDPLGGGGPGGPPAAALFVNELLQMLQHRRADGRYWLAPAGQRRLLAAIEGCIAVSSTVTARQILPGLASKMIKLAGDTLRADGMGVNRVGVASVRAVAVLLRRSFSPANSYEATELLNLQAAQISGARASITHNPEHDDDAVARVNADLKRTLLFSGATTVNAAAPARRGTSSAEVAALAATGNRGSGARWAIQAVDKLTALGEPLGRLIANELQRVAGAGALEEGCADAATLADLLVILCGGSDQAPWIQRAAYDAIDLASASPGDLGGSQLTRGLLSLWSSAAVSVGLTRTGFNAPQTAPPDLVHAAVRRQLTQEAVQAVLGASGATSSLASLAVLRGTWALGVPPPSDLSSTAIGFQSKLLQRVCACAGDSTTRAYASRHAAELLLLMSAPTPTGSTWQAFADLVDGPATALVDDWDRYELHPGLFTVLAVLCDYCRTSLADPADFVFGGAWSSLWRLIRCSRNVWQIEHRYKECTVAQQQHRAAVLCSALDCVGTVALAAGMLPEEACEVWLVDALYPVLACCACPVDGTVREAGIRCLHRIATSVQLQEHETSSKPTAAAASGPRLAAQLFTRCGDYVTDAALMRLPEGGPSGRRQVGGGFFDPVAWRPLPTSERVDPLGGGVEAQPLDDAAEDADVSECVTACHVLEAFTRVVCAAATNADKPHDDDGDDPAEHVAFVLDSGLALEPFIRAISKRAAELLVAHASRRQPAVPRHVVASCVRLLRATLEFTAACSAAYDEHVFAGPRPERLPLPKDGALPDLAALEYNRNMPLWLMQLHAAAEEALRALLPLLNNTASTRGTDSSGPDALASVVLKGQLDILSAVKEALRALSSTRPPLRYEEQNPDEEPSNGVKYFPVHTAGHGAIDDSCWPPAVREPRLSDTYLPHAYQVFSALSRVVDAVPAGSHSAVSPSALADRALSVYQRAVEARAPSRKGGDASVVPLPQSVAIEVRRVAREIRQAPTISSDLVSAAGRTCLHLARLVPSFLYTRVRDNFVPALLVHWARYVLAEEPSLLTMATRRHHVVGCCSSGADSVTTGTSVAPSEWLLALRPTSKPANQLSAAAPIAAKHADDAREIWLAGEEAVASADSTLHGAEHPTDALSQQLGSGTDSPPALPRTLRGQRLKRTAAHLVELVNAMGDRLEPQPEARSMEKLSEFRSRVHACLLGDALPE
jgi:hypothetical protein